jgi:ATP-dependent Clp protease protease subunit
MKNCGIVEINMRLNKKNIFKGSSQSSPDDFEPSKLLFDNRQIFLIDEITKYTASEVVGKLLYLDSVSNVPIRLYINSQGGEITAGLALYDVMRSIKSPVVTVGLGECCSMGAVILAAGDLRWAYRNTAIMIHQASGGAGGKTDEIATYSKEMGRVNKLLVQIIALHTKKDPKTVLKDLQLDKWMSAKQAKKYNIIDEIIG